MMCVECTVLNEQIVEAETVTGGQWVPCCDSARKEGMKILRSDSLVIIWTKQHAESIMLRVVYVLVV